MKTTSPPRRVTAPAARPLKIRPSSSARVAGPDLVGAGPDALGANRACDSFSFSTSVSSHSLTLHSLAFHFWSAKAGMAPKRSMGQYANTALP